MLRWLSSFFYSPTFDSYEAAGCIFTNGIHVLAGLQKKKGAQILSGFGGSKRYGETYTRTALREVIEELLEVDVTDSLLVTVELRVKPSHIYLRGSYVLLQYTFEDLEEILRLIEPFCRHTHLYTFYPYSVIDLLVNRQKTQGEVSTLSLLPLNPTMQISKDFLGDLHAIH
jgi:hypothetical protein